MSDQQQALAIKRKIIGALIADARQSSGKTIQECGSLLNISEADFTAFETGEAAPTLPQLEVLAFYLNVPINHFWGDKTLAVARKEDEIRESVGQMLAVRNKLLGATLRAVREETGRTPELVAEQAGIVVDEYRSYETGDVSAPVDVLQAIAGALSINIDELVDEHGSVGNWLRAQSDFEEFSKMPDDLRAFVLKPVNRSYLELAVRLSGMSVQRLRGIAEGILDITY